MLIKRQARQLARVPNFSLIQQSDGLNDSEISRCIHHLYHYFDLKSPYCIGYQVNLDFDYSSLFEFLNFNINNVGDPYVNSNYGVHSRLVEQPVIEFFAKLFHAPDQDYWGYVTSGGTEANLYGLYTGQRYLESLTSTSTVPVTPIAYFSEDTHYSIRKVLRMLKVPQVVIPSTPQGAIQVPKLIEAIQLSDWRTHPPLIVVTLGTSFKCAYDDVADIADQLQQHQIDRFYIHVDAALGGLFLPFLESLMEQRQPLETALSNVPVFDFRLPIGSIAVSGHKVIGTPCPCAIFLTLKSKMSEEWEAIDYIGTVDSTLSGSRNGLAAILLWYALAKKGISGLRAQALDMLAIADYATQKIQAAGFHAWRNDLGLAVVFDRPPDWIIHKWSLSTVGDYAHLFAMGHVTQDLIDKFVQDLEQSKQSGHLIKVPNPPATTHPALNCPVGTVC